MSRLFYIVIFFAAAVIFLAVGLYVRLQHNALYFDVDLMKEESELTNSRKLHSPYLVFVVAVISAVAVFRISSTGMGCRYASVGKFIIAVPILALLNALVSRGRERFIFSNIILFALFLYLGIIFIDLPKKSPVIEIDDTKIILSKTTFGELKEQGFDIYIQEYRDATVGYYDLLTSGEFKKYANDRSVFLENGFENMTAKFFYPRYLLTRGDVVIGDVGLYADKYNNKALEDCKIVYFKLNEDFIKGLKVNSISLKLDGTELLSPIRFEILKKTFGEKVTSNYISGLYKSDRYYGISWATRSDHIFWNEYFSDIYYDEQNNMTAFEITAEIARDEY